MDEGTIKVDPSHPLHRWAFREHVSEELDLDEGNSSFNPP